MGVAVASVLRVQDDISAEDERGHGVLKEHDNETEDSNKEGSTATVGEIRAGVFPRATPFGPGPERTGYVGSRRSKCIHPDRPWRDRNGQTF